MKFSSFLKTVAAVGVAGGLTAAVSMDANAADKRVKWKMHSTFGSKLTQLGTGGKRFEKLIKEISGGNIQIKFFEPGALVPALQGFDAVQAGSVDASWGAAGYWVGKIPAAGFFTAVPFGPRASEYLAWIKFGGGQELYDELYAEQGVKGVFCGIIAPEASGWFRKEIKGLDDLKGLKMRFFGLGARVMEKMGVSTQLLASGDIFPALERGTIDATEFSMPAIDLKLGFYQVAKHYYFPGWHQQSSILELLVKKDKWDALSDTQRMQILHTCDANIAYMLAEGEAIQVAALQELQSKGVTLHRWPQDFLDALQKAWDEVLAEESAKNAGFKKVAESLGKFRENYKTWKDMGYLN